MTIDRPVTAMVQSSRFLQRLRRARSQQKQPTPNNAVTRRAIARLNDLCKLPGAQVSQGDSGRYCRLVESYSDLAFPTIHHASAISSPERIKGSRWITGQ